MSNVRLTEEDVQKILRMIEATENVAEFHLRFGDLEIGFSRANGAMGTGSEPVPRASPARMGTGSEPVPKASAGAPAPNVVPAVQQAQPRQAAPAPPKAKPAAVPAGATAITAPMVGTFYRAPAPGAPPFVEEGAKVEPDTILCIIEVMKLMNSIPAGVRGTVRSIHVNDAEAVDFGQVLMVIEPER